MAIKRIFTIGEDALDEIMRKEFEKVSSKVSMTFEEFRERFIERNMKGLDFKEDPS